LKRHFPNRLERGLEKTERLLPDFCAGQGRDFHLFKPLDDTKDPDFAYQNTRLSPKGLVYPQSERMFEVNLDEKDPEANVYRESVKDYSLAQWWASGPAMPMGFKS